MPAGQWEKCGTTGAKNPRGYAYRCNKKAGHKGEHADTSESPAIHWKDKD